MLSMVEQTRKLLEGSKSLLPQGRMRELEALFEEKCADTRIKILLYGPYNSGKTVLANALAGRHLFTSGVTPETTELQPVQFAEFQLVDSPGFNAPEPKEEELSRKAARWDADLVLFVITTESHHESERIWQEVNDLLQRGRQVMVVVNEKRPLNQEERNNIGNQIGSRLALAVEGSKGTGVMGPVFVNAESALRARTATARKENLEKQSRIRVLEGMVQEWLATIGSYAPLATAVLALHDALKAELVSQEEGLTDGHEEYKKVLDDIGKLQRELESLIETEVKARLSDLDSMAKKIAWSSEDQVMDTMWNTWLEALENGVTTLRQKVRAKLIERLSRTAEDLPESEELAKILQSGQVVIEKAFLALPPGDSAAYGSASARDVALPMVETQFAGSEAPELGTLTGQWLGIGSLAKAAVIELEEAGLLRAVTRYGKAGKFFAKSARFAPFIGFGLDIGLAIHEIFRAKKQRQKAIERAERRIEEQARRERERRELLQQCMSQGARQTMDACGAELRAAVARALSPIRRAVQRKLEEEVRASKAVRERLDRLSRAIDECVELLEAVHSKAITKA